ncbi:4-hydroxy-tetrahydrodipicolinate reductase [Sphingobium sp. CR28]|uniref:4-hydroxy-tetrahydrodipicolinate reductase n=1 Tax=Sphingobium sp. CR28 TaxID=3400272 RepID=UPI003FF083CB
MTAIGIFGVTGRMAQAITLEATSPDVTIVGGIDREGRIHGEHQTLAALVQAANVFIDFTMPEGLRAHLAIATEARKPLMIGTTGLFAEDHQAIDDAATVIPIVQAYNTSLGIAMLSHLVREATNRLGPDWDIEIVETHHRHKVDAPSGTALLLGTAAADGRGATLQDLSRFNRIGFEPHARETGTIGYASLRGGSVAGDHMVVLAGDDERIELGHRAENRRIFARGAVRAAQWLVGKAPGRYTMSDVLGI